MKWLSIIYSKSNKTYRSLYNSFIFSIIDINVFSLMHNFFLTLGIWARLNSCTWRLFIYFWYLCFVFVRFFSCAWLFLDLVLTMLFLFISHIFGPPKITKLNDRTRTPPSVKLQNLENPVPVKVTYLVTSS